MGDRSPLRRSEGSETREHTCGRAKSYWDPNTCICHCLGFHSCFLLPGVCSEVFSSRDDSGVGIVIFHHGARGRLLQGAGSAFAFTGAVYLAAHGFSARYLATAIGVTQGVGMLGGSAGQFVVGPMIEHGVGVHALWVGLGVIILANGLFLYLAAPKETVRTTRAGRRPWVSPENVQDSLFESSVPPRSS
jgi:MFS family permease